MVKNSVYLYYKFAIVFCQVFCYYIITMYNDEKYAFYQGI